MRLQQIKITNYRNLDGLDVTINPDMNFIIGENDLGKSNFLDLLDILFNRRSFARSDFFLETNPIEVQISIQLDDDELGIFEDYFDPLDKNIARFIARQDDPEDLVAYFRSEGRGAEVREINFSPLRRVNYIKYDSLRTPKDELGFDSDRGVGKFLNFLVRNTLDSAVSGSELLNTAALDPISKRINSLLQRIRPIQRMGVETFFDQNNQAELIARILLLKGAGDFDIQKSGTGVQFATLLILSILERLITMRTSRRWKDNILIVPLQSIPKSALDVYLAKNNLDISTLLAKLSINGDNVVLNHSSLDESNEIDNKLKRFFERRSAAIIIGIDEPEVHLHPYMQRSLINYIRRILSNKDEDFKVLLSELLDIDEIDGQAVVVSHSPNILLDDYKQIVRFFREPGKIKAVSGFQLNFDPKLEKHLLMNFPGIKEAFFSRCVVIVEGVSEQGAMSVWKDIALGNSDELGISIIGADGNENIPPIVKLLNELKITNVSIMDQDDDNSTKYLGVPNLMFTSLRNFEEEIYDFIHKLKPGVPELYKAVKEFSRNGLGTLNQRNKLTEIANKYGINSVWDTNRNQYRFSDPETLAIAELKKTMFLGWMGSSKSVTFGRYMANNTQGIPTVYLNLLQNAKQKAEMVS